MRITRRALQVGLGALWLLDGALQLQPVMLTRRFALGVIAPAAIGQPAPLHVAITLPTRIILHDPVAFDALFAGVQILLGPGLLVRRTARAALGASVAWALGIWVLGEGLGGILVPGASIPDGAPGAAALYVLLALGASPSSISYRALARPAVRRALASASTALPAPLGHVARGLAGAVASGGGGTGTATDPNTGPLIVLLALATWSSQATAGRVRGLAAPAVDAGRREATDRVRAA